MDNGLNDFCLPVDAFPECTLDILVGHSMSVVTKDGRVFLFCSEFEYDNAVYSTENVTIVTYPTWIFIEDFAIPGQEKEVQNDPNNTFRMALEVMPEKGKSKVGFEKQWMPFTAFEFLCDELGRDNLIDCSTVISEARAIKTPWEIECLRAAAHCAELAMLKTAKDTVPGMTEADIARMLNMACFEVSADVTDVTQTNVMGEHFSPAFVPRHFRVNAGDIVRLDGGPNIFGYNADIGRTFAVRGAKASDRHERLFDTLYAGFETAMNMIGPGVRMCDVYYAIQKCVWDRGETNYLRGHQGHSISCGKFCEEYPFIAPDETRVFEPGMVFCVEMPYYGTASHSYLIEDTILITENGIERFTVAPGTLYIS